MRFASCFVCWCCECCCCTGHRGISAFVAAFILNTANWLIDSIFITNNINYRSIFECLLFSLLSLSPRSSVPLWSNEIDNITWRRWMVSDPSRESTFVCSIIRKRLMKINRRIDHRCAFHNHKMNQWFFSRSLPIQILCFGPFGFLFHLLSHNNMNVTPCESSAQRLEFDQY